MNTSTEYEPGLTPAGRDDTLLNRLAERIGVHTRAATVFGTPVERDGVTVIPVAKARWGFGGGGGRKAKDEGLGGGGGAMVTPIGYIELTNGRSRFLPIREPASYLPLVLAGGAVLVWLVRSIDRFGGS